MQVRLLCCACYNRSIGVRNDVFFLNLIRRASEIGDGGKVRILIKLEMLDLMLRTSLFSNEGCGWLYSFRVVLRLHCGLMGWIGIIGMNDHIFYDCTKYLRTYAKIIKHMSVLVKVIVSVHCLLADPYYT